MIHDIEIRNFRGFGHLKLEGLGRVNLVVGRNNSGKTSLLEAITLISNNSSFAALPTAYRTTPESIGGRFYSWLIRDGVGIDGAEIRCNGVKSSWKLSISRNQARPLAPSGTVAELNFPGVNAYYLNAVPNLRLRSVSIQQQPPESIVSAFAEAVRPADGEAQMESLLRCIDPRVRTVRLDYSQGGPPFIVVDIGLSERVPLSQAGQGIYRMVAVFSELLGQRPEICLIDEIENGIHYTALGDVWAGIAEVAARLDLQVFASTHSGECLAAAHQAFCKRPSYDLRVIQLYREGSQVSGRVLNQAQIETGLAADIDLR